MNGPAMYNLMYAIQFAPSNLHVEAVYYILHCTAYTYDHFASHTMMGGICHTDVMVPCHEFLALK